MRFLIYSITDRICDQSFFEEMINRYNAQNPGENLNKTNIYYKFTTMINFQKQNLAIFDLLQLMQQWGLEYIQKQVTDYNKFTQYVIRDNPQPPVYFSLSMPETQTFNSEVQTNLFNPIIGNSRYTPNIDNSNGISECKEIDKSIFLFPRSVDSTIDASNNALNRLANYKICPRYDTGANFFLVFSFFPFVFNIF
jgi:hypothetical protein